MFEKSRRTLFTISTATALCGAYWLYGLAVSPLVDSGKSVGPMVGDAAGHAGELPPVRNVQMANQYLASAPWAADAKYQFSTSDETYVFAEEWNRVESNGAVRFQPFAMIWFQNPGNPAEVPVTLVAESALVQFQNSFDVANPNPGRVVGGSLEGDVHVEGPEGLLIDGRNFTYSETAMRIWSDNAVRFAYGPHTGKAHGVQLELTPAVQPTNDGALAATGVRSVRLRRDVVMDLLFNEQKREKVQIRCVGAFEFVLETRIGTFEDHVRVHRPTSPDKADTLFCDLMTLIFEEHASREQQATASLQPDDSAVESTDEKPRSFASLGGKLTFRRLRADGRNVVLQSAQNDLTAQMTELIYDAKTRVAAMLDGNAVRVRHRASDLNCPEITVVHGQDGKITSAWCRGAGTLTHRDDETGEVVLSASWLKQMRKYPEAQTGLDIIELHEQAVVRQRDRNTGISGELIKLWLTADSLDAAARHDLNDGRLEPHPQGQRPPSEKLRPERMLALKNVIMASPQMRGETQRLEVWFENASPSEPLPTGPLGHQSRSALVPAAKRVARTLPFSAEHAPREIIRLPATRSLRRGALLSEDSESRLNQRAFASVRDAEASSFRQTSSTQFAGGLPVNQQPQSGATTSEPMIVTADLIRVRVVQGPESSGPNEMNVAEVWTEGNVHVTQPREAGGEPLRLTGDRLHLKNHGEQRHEVHVFGEPAKIRDRSAYIEGQEIFLDRARNRTWIEGAGLLRLPVNNDLEGRKLSQPGVLDIWWQEQMTFDGEVADFYGSVRAVLQDNRMRCDQMHVELTSRISFSDDRPGGDNVEIRSIVCKDGVEFESYEYEEAKLIGVRRASFWEFTLNQLTGDTEASGPGQVLFWRRGRANRASLSPSAVAAANQPLQSDSAEWEYSRIDFAGKTTGNLKKRQSTFHDRVRILYGPVVRPLDVIDPDDLPKDAGWMRCDILYFSQTPETKTEPAYSQLLASGNAELEGRSFHGRADTISYDESKGLYILRSTGSRMATIWRQKQIGDELSRADAQRMEFIPARNQLKLDRTTGLQGLQ